MVSIESVFMCPGAAKYRPGFDMGEGAGKGPVAAVAAVAAVATIVMATCCVRIRILVKDMNTVADE